MKTIRTWMVCLAAMAMPLMLQAQGTSLFEKYADKKLVTSVYISKAMMEMNPKVFVDDPVIGKVARNLDVVKIISCNHSSVTEEFKRDFRQLVKQDKYELLMKQKQQNSMAEFYIVRKGNKIAELVMLVVRNNFSLRYVALIGELSLKDIQSIIQSEQAYWDGKNLQLKDFDLRSIENFSRSFAGTQAAEVCEAASEVYEEAMKAYEKGMEQYRKQQEKLQKQYDAMGCRVYKID